MTTLAATTAAVVRRTFAPPTRLTVSQWVDRYGWIARGSGAAEPGPYSTERAPYMREILDVMGDEIHRDVVFNKPHQVGFTEALNQFIGYCMAEDPSGIIVIQPDIERAKGWMKERIDPLLAESAKLKGIVRSEGGRRSSDDTMHRKVFAGGYLACVGANSPAGLRSRAARRILGDERSGWTLDAKQQGDPWDLAVKRTTTFWNAKRIQGSTPGSEGSCPITDALHESDWRRWVLACPACGKEEPFEWRTEDKTYRIVCERDPANQIIPETAKYLCTTCGVLIPEEEKARMNRRGQWVATQPGREMVGFDLGNSLMSPWRSWADLMKDFRAIQGNQERLKTFVTQDLAEVWKAPAERIDVHMLEARVEEYGPLVNEEGQTITRPVPDKVAVLTASVDVQKDRLESLVIGWGADEEAFVLQWAQHDGDPLAADTWNAVWKALTYNFGAPLKAVAVDTNYLTPTVWKYVNQWNALGVARVFGIKGESGRPRPIMGRPAASSARRAHRPWLVGVDVCKDTLELRLYNPVPPGGPDAVHFSDALPHEFFLGLTAEEKVAAIVGGRPTKVWRPRPNMRNEPLDLFNYALAALHGIPGLIAALGKMAAERVAKLTAPPETPAPAPRGIQTPRDMPVRSQGGWVSSIPRRRW